MLCCKMLVMGPWLHLLFCRLGPMAWNNCMKYLCQRLSGGQILFSSVQLSHSVVSDSLRPPWITARQASLSITNSRNLFKLIPLSRWRYPAISSSVVPFSSCPQSLPVSGSFPMSQLFAWGRIYLGWFIWQMFLTIQVRPISIPYTWHYKHHGWTTS